MAINFADVANKKLSEVEKPPLPPMGLYRWSIIKLPEVTKSSDGKWEFLTINVRALEAIDADMEDYKGEVTNITNRVQFIFDTEDEVAFERTLYNAKRFFQDHVRCADDSDSLSEAINKSVNGQFLGQIAWASDKKDPEAGPAFANITRTAPLD